MDSKQKVIFLCTGNSCRSQMAEGLLRQMAGERFEALSAGTQPAAELHPLAIKAMAEIGCDISGQKPKNVKEYLGQTLIHWIITVCDKANQSCPRIWPMASEAQRLHWPFDDPASATGGEEERMAFFRRVRDEIRQQLEQWIKSLS